MKTVAFITLGCKVNQYETNAMSQKLIEEGYKIVEHTQKADIYIINTCTVTNMSDRKSRQMIRRAKEINPEAIIIAVGCYVQVAKKEIENIKEIDLALGNEEKVDIVKYCNEIIQKNKKEEISDVMQSRKFAEFGETSYTEKTRAVIKVQDGCDRFCSYCIIPYARGRVRSRSRDSVLEEVKTLAANGYKEVVLTGIEISTWGQDFKNGQGLIDLMEALASAAPELRLRLGSLEPRTVTEDFCRRAAALPQLCPQFHLSLQSGCDATLKRMNRKYDTARFAQSVALLNQYFEHPAITTDLITGFPEETEEEFSETLAFLRRCGFARLHVFPYSIRPGTPAAKMTQVPKAIKEERARRAIALGRELHEEYMEKCIGQVYPVLFEQPSGAHFSGHAPNYMEVGVAADGLHNVVKNVKIVGIDGEILRGELT